MSLLDIVQQHLGNNEVQQMSQKIGADPQTTNKAIQAAVPMMLGGMAQTAQQPNGANAIQRGIEQFGSGGATSSLGGVADMIGGASGGGAGAMLEGILGQHTSTVQNGVQSASGLDAGKSKMLLTMLAPIVMKAVAQHHASQPQGAPGGIGGMLQQAASSAQQNSSSSHVGGVLGNIMGKL